jgi:hypothetical protein
MDEDRCPSVERVGWDPPGGPRALAGLPKYGTSNVTYMDNARSEDSSGTYADAWISSSAINQMRNISGPPSKTYNWLSLPAYVYATKIQFNWRNYY